MIVLQFSREATLGSAIIRWNTRSPWSHVDIVQPDGRLLGARLEGGVQSRPAGYAHFTATEHYGIPLTDASTELFHALARQQIGKAYDWSAILGLAFYRNWHDPGRWFCSELVAWLAQSVQYPLVRVAHDDRITPRDLTTSYRLKPVPTAL